MWIVVRLFLAITAYLMRTRLSARRIEPTDQLEGVPYFVDLTVQKEKVRRFRIGTPLAAPWFKLTRESDVDRFFKAIGMAQEAESGDPDFDRLIYVAGDHPAVHDLLRRSGPARAVIQEAFAAGFTRISSNGACLTLEHPEGRGPTTDEKKLLVRLRAAMGGLEGSSTHPFADGFVWKAVAVEAAVWSILGYAVGSVIDLFINREDYHLHTGPLLLRGFGAALLLFVSLVGTIGLFLRGSSRGHRILVECAIVLTLGLPVAGVQLVSDLNRGLDGPSEVVFTREIRDVEKRRHRRSTSYYLHLAPQLAGDPTGLPTRIEVERSVYERARAGAVAALHVAPGWLGLPWYRRIEILRAR
jgi:hypothetical protein